MDFSERLEQELSEHLDLGVHAERIDLHEKSTPPRYPPRLSDSCELTVVLGLEDAKKERFTLHGDATIVLEVHDTSAFRDFAQFVARAVLDHRGLTNDREGFKPRYIGEPPPFLGAVSRGLRLLPGGWREVLRQVSPDLPRRLILRRARGCGEAIAMVDLATSGNGFVAAVDCSPRFVILRYSTS